MDTAPATKTCMHYSNLRRGETFVRDGVRWYAVRCAGCGDVLRETDNEDDYRWWLHATTSEIRTAHLQYFRS